MTIHFKPFKFGKPELILIGVLVGLSILVIGISTIPPITHAYEQLNLSWTKLAVRFGYAGAFLAALIGNLTVVIVFPYTVIIFFLATSGLEPFWLGLLTGVGAWLGELSGYLLGRWGSSTFQKAKPEEYEALEKIVASRPRFVHWLLFLFGALPLPDDILFIPLGMLRYPMWKLFWPSVLGKIAAGFMITYAGNAASGALNNASVTSPQSIISQLGSLFTLAIAMYVMFRLDWNRMMHQLLDPKTPPSAQV